MEDLSCTLSVSLGNRSLEIVPQIRAHTEHIWYLEILRAVGEECLKSCVSSGLTKFFQNIIKCS